LPLLYEDEGMAMGESSLHTQTCDILLYGLSFHFAGRSAHRVFGNLNLHYSARDANAYVSPDVMVVKPRRRLPPDLSSYGIGQDGPVPLLVAEVLSFRTYQEGDLVSKPILYADIGISEYVLADVTGAMLPQKLLKLNRQTNGIWRDEQDTDGGVTSRLGFRVVLDADGQLRVLDVRAGKRYARPQEAQEVMDRLAGEAEAHRQAEERVLALEAEVARLRAKESKRRRKS
jgi:Uma2 family endonuclease